MSDEHAPMYSSVYGHPIVQTPNMERLANAGVTFDASYCNSPICMASRMSFMTGRYISNIGAWDNVTPLPSNEITWAHRFRNLGYDVALSGKQHFGGGDQLHGFQAQLARDLHSELYHPIHQWDDGVVDSEQPWQSVYEAGPGTTEEIIVDDLVQEKSLEYLRDPSRKDTPWVLNASFIAPHFPLIAPQRFWEMYPVEDMDLPEIPEGHLENLHPVYKRMSRMFGFPTFPDDIVRQARAGYYALISYLDEKIGQLIDVLEETGQLENTVIIHTSDHGDMTGEHGMWRKSNFYEASSRVPLQIAWQNHIPAGTRIPEVVSLVDVIATICDIAGDETGFPLDGDSFLDLITVGDDNWKDEAFSEYLAHGVINPMAMLRQGRYKLNYSLNDPVELYDLQDDPSEFNNLADSPDHQYIVQTLTNKLLSDWDPVDLNEKVRATQRKNRFIENTIGNSWRKPRWD
jgi:choline-sulfatase